MPRYILAVLAALFFTNASHATDDWPTKQITLVVGFAAGGNTDLAARILANSMKQSLSVPVVVENKAGAGGTVGAAFVSKATADGSIFLVASQSETTMLKANRANPRYDIDKDLVPIAKLMDQDYVLVIPASLGIKSWSEFLSHAKSQGSLSYATAGVGTTAHVLSERLVSAIGVKGVHVPYQGASSFRTDLVSGRVDFSIDVIPLSQPFITDGRLRAIAITQKGQDARLPGVPSLVELGVFPQQYAGWTGLFAPKGAPPEVRAKALALVDRMLASAGGEEIRKSGYRPAAADQGPEDFARFVASDQKLWLTTFQQLGIPPLP